MFTSVEMDISASEIDVRILDSTQVYLKTVAERLKRCHKVHGKRIKTNSSCLQ